MMLNLQLYTCLHLLLQKYKTKTTLNFMLYIFLVNICTDICE